MEALLHIIDDFIHQVIVSMDAMRVENVPHLKNERAVETFIQITFARDAIRLAHDEGIDTGDRSQVVQDLATETLRLLYI